jgi:hypothetical protein
MFYLVRLIDHDSTVLASCEEQNLKDAKRAARDYLRDPEYFSAEPHKSEVLNEAAQCVFDKFAPAVSPPVDDTRKRQLDRLALFAAQHSFPVRIAYAYDCVTVGIPWSNVNGQRGIQWQHARTLKQLRSVLGY